MFNLRKKGDKATSTETTCKIGPRNMYIAEMEFRTMKYSLLNVLLTVCIISARPTAHEKRSILGNVLDTMQRQMEEAVKSTAALNKQQSLENEKSLNKISDDIIDDSFSALGDKYGDVKLGSILEDAYKQMDVVYAHMDATTGGRGGQLGKAMDTLMELNGDLGNKIDDKKVGGKLDSIFGQLGSQFDNLDFINAFEDAWKKFGKAFGDMGVDMKDAWNIIEKKINGTLDNMKVHSKDSFGNVGYDIEGVLEKLKTQFENRLDEGAKFGNGHRFGDPLPKCSPGDDSWLDIVCITE